MNYLQVKRQFRYCVCDTSTRRQWSHLNYRRSDNAMVFHTEHCTIGMLFCGDVVDGISHRENFHYYIKTFGINFEQNALASMHGCMRYISPQCACVNFGWVQFSAISS